MTPREPEAVPRLPWLLPAWWVVFYLSSGLLAYNLWFVQPVVDTGENFRATWLYRYGDPWLWWLLLPLILGWRRRLAVDPLRWWRLAGGHAIGAGLTVLLALTFRAGLLLVPNRLPLSFLPEVWRDTFQWQSAVGFAGAYFAIVVPVYAWDFYHGWRAGQKEAAELKLANAQMETRLVRANLDALKMQLHPHFLFNALNSATALIRRGRTEEAEETVAKLGTLLRRALNHRQELLVTLAEELEFLEDYFAIERIRFQDRLEVRFDIAPDCRFARVPSLLLQPLVENAMKHGFSRLPAARLLHLRVWRAGDQLHLELYNDGPALTGVAAVGGTGIGLRNTRVRLQMMFGAAAELRLQNAPPNGVSARVTLPFETPDHEKNQNLDR